MLKMPVAQKILLSIWFYYNSQFNFMKRSFFIKLLILLGFFDCFWGVAKLRKNDAKKILLSHWFYWVNIEGLQSEGNFEGGKGLGEAEESKPASTFRVKKKKRSAKITLAFARAGKMLMNTYIYNIIYNII